MTSSCWRLIQPAKAFGRNWLLQRQCKPLKSQRLRFVLVFGPYEVDHDFLEHAHHEELDQPELPWEP